MKEAMEWLYPKVIENRDLAALDSRLFRRLIQLWCIAGRHDGFLPSVDDLAWALRAEWSGVLTDLEDLKARGFLEEIDGRLRPTGLGEVVKAKLTKAKVFVKPTPEEVTDYAKTIGFVLDGRAFCDFYESRGWLIGRVSMKDWKAAVRTWKARRQEETAPSAPRPRRGPVDLKGE